MWISNLELLPVLPFEIKDTMCVGLEEMKTAKQRYRQMKNRSIQNYSSSNNTRTTNSSNTTRVGIVFSNANVKQPHRILLPTPSKADSGDSSRITDRTTTVGETVGETALETALERCQDLEKTFLNPSQHFVSFPHALLVDWLAIVPQLYPTQLWHMLSSSPVRGMQMVVCYIYFIGFDNFTVEDEMLRLVNSATSAAASIDAASTSVNHRVVVATTGVARTPQHAVIHRRLLDEGATWRSVKIRGGYACIPSLSEVAGLLEKL